MQHMSIDMTRSMQLRSSNDTEKFGEQLGRNLRGGEVIELISDLGGGKTTLTRGIARGAGSSDVVGSPTFMLSKVYKTQKFDIHHFDFYRLTEPGIMENELHDMLADPDLVLVIEWGEIVKQALPQERLSIQINKVNDEVRQLNFTYPEQLAYMLECT